MKELLEEYGMVIAAAFAGMIILGILAQVMIPGSPINKLLVAVMP